MGYGVHPVQQASCGQEPESRGKTTDSAPLMLQLDYAEKTENTQVTEGEKAHAGV